MVLISSWTCALSTNSQLVIKLHIPISGLCQQADILCFLSLYPRITPTPSLRNSVYTVICNSKGHVIWQAAKCWYWMNQENVHWWLLFLQYPLVATGAWLNFFMFMFWHWQHLVNDRLKNEKKREMKHVLSFDTSQKIQKTKPCGDYRKQCGVAIEHVINVIEPQSPWREEVRLERWIKKTFDFTLSLQHGRAICFQLTVNLSFF